MSPPVAPAHGREYSTPRSPGSATCAWIVPLPPLTSPQANPVGGAGFDSEAITTAPLLRPDDDQHPPQPRAGRSRAASLRISGCGPAKGHTSRAARTVRPARTRRSGGRRAPPAVRHDFELEPRASRQLHFRREPQSSARFVRLDPPEVEGVADGRRFGIAPPATHPHAAHQQVDRAPDSPQPRAEIPAALAPNPRDGNKRAVRIDRHVDPASVDQLATEARVGRRRCRSSRGARIRPSRQRERTILVADGATDRFAQADRSIGNTASAVGSVTTDWFFSPAISSRPTRA